MIDSSTTIDSAQSKAESATLVSDLLLLVKSRLTFLVVITTFIGYCLGSTGAFDWWRLIHTVIGTALVAAAAAAFNQVFEVDVDRLMARTRNRPIASGRISRTAAALLGGGMGAAGLVQLAFMTNFMAAYLAAASFITYIVMYTPMKRRSSFCVTVGAVSGALPPMVGWAAAENPGGPFALGSWVLFGVLFAWQMPHFLAIAWMYRDEYSQAGFVMLPKWDLSGVWTAWQSLAYSVALIGITLVPFITGEAGVVYLIGSSIFNFLMLGYAVLFLIQRNRLSARRLFFASIVYLPAVLCLMVFFRF